MTSQYYRLFAIVIIFSPSLALAESLESAWQTAIASNNQLKAAQANTDVTEQQLAASLGARLPTVSVGSGYTQYSETFAAKTEIANQNFQFNTAQSGSAKAQAIASVPVFTSGRISHNIDAAEASLQAMEANENSALLSLKMQVAEAYVSVLRNQSTVEVAQHHVESLAAHALEVQHLLSEGMVARNDSLAANVEELNARQALVQAINQLDNAKARFNQLLARKLDAPVNLEAISSNLPKGSLEVLTDLAFKQRSELAALTGQIETLNHQAKGVQAEQLPQVAVNGGYVYQENRFQLNQGMWMANVDMQWKLFDPQATHRSDALNGQAVSLKAQREDLLGQIALQVRQAWLATEETKQRIHVTLQAVEQAQENKQITNERFRQGLATASEVLKAEELWVTAQANFHNANHDAALAALRLRRAVEML